jgi:hypothetical protein
VPVVYSDPNQTNLLDQIAEVEAEEVIDRNITIDEVIDEEVQEYEVKEEQEDKVCDETIIYTDPMGNTFETTSIAPCAGHDAETEKEIEKETIEDTKDEFALADNFDLDFNEETNEETDSIPDFF